MSEAWILPSGVLCEITSYPEGYIRILLFWEQKSATYLLEKTTPVCGKGFGLGVDIASRAELPTKLKTNSKARANLQISSEISLAEALEYSCMILYDPV